MPRWKKLGRIFQLEASDDRSTTHTQVPTVLVKDNVVRVYFAARNLEGKSYPGYFDLDRYQLDSLTIVRTQEKPVIEYGAPGTFDDDGIMPAYVIKRDEGVWMYYSGWNRRVTVPYHNSTGLAVSYDGGDKFVRKFEGPIMDRTPLEPNLAVTPFVIKEEDSWKVWYVSGLSWQKIGDKFEPVYVIKYASSTDGISWERSNKVCIEQKHPLEAFSHPSVIKHADTYHMWYCFRDSKDFRGGGGSYRIGYAYSNDGLNWQRADAEAGICPSEDGWESDMQCYPYVLTIDDITYMFYNGNGFGQSGVGLAVLENW
jgi:hypothetical protein